MSDNYSLVTILRTDPDFAKALAKKKEAVKKDKQNLVKAANTYTEQHKEEILEGTRKRQLLLSEGQDSGLTEEEIMKEYGKFLPTISTPILNLLYFILRESEEIDRELYKNRDLANQKIKGWEDNYQESDAIKEQEDMFSYLYGNITLEVFNKLKKLKGLTKSECIEESTLAFRKCRELCDKYNIDYERIPSY